MYSILIFVNKIFRKKIDNLNYWWNFCLQSLNSLNCKTHSILKKTAYILPGRHLHPKILTVLSWILGSFWVALGWDRLYPTPKCILGFVFISMLYFWGKYLLPGPDFMVLILFSFKKNFIIENCVWFLFNDSKKTLNGFCKNLSNF